MIKKTLIVTNYKYSYTTTKHINTLMLTFKGETIEVFSQIDLYDTNLIEQCVYLVKNEKKLVTAEIKKIADKRTRAKTKKDFYTKRIATLYSNYIKLAKLFKVQNNFPETELKAICGDL